MSERVARLERKMENEVKRRRKNNMDGEVKARTDQRGKFYKRKHRRS
jgi:hypothetical protein